VSGVAENSIAMPAGADAAEHCRLSERLFHQGRRDEALACARIAFVADPDGERTADFCAWVFSNCGVHDEAAAAYARLLARWPEWAAGHRHISGSLAMAGRLDRAVVHAARASDLDPGVCEFAFHAGVLCDEAGQAGAAHRYFARAAALEPGNPAVLRRLSTAAFALDRGEEAVDLALQALAAAPRDQLSAIHAAELLLRQGRFEDGATIAHEAAAFDPGDPIVLRLSSAAEMLCGRAEQALVAIDRAIEIDPRNDEYHLHRGNLLHRLGRFDEAAEAFAAAAALDPADPQARRSQLTALYDGGRLVEALAVGGQLLQAAPDNEEYAEAVLQIVNRRLELFDGMAVAPGRRAAPRQRLRRPSPRLWDGLATQCRVIHALIVRETRTRFADSLLGYGWALLEPVLHIVMLFLVFAVMMRGRPPIGSDFFVFYYTGIIPYHIFVHSSSSMTYAITSNLSLLQLPRVTTFDVVIARGLLEFVTDLAVAALLLAGFYALGRPAMPRHIGDLAGAILTVWLLACGCGMINAVLNAFVKAWDKIWAQATRFLYFISGIFYVPAMMPDWLRDTLAWNPILHAVDWFRAGFFPEYEPHWLDRGYLALAATVALLAGFVLERGLRRRLFEPS